MPDRVGAGQQQRVIVRRIGRLPVDRLDPEQRAGNRPPGPVPAPAPRWPTGPAPGRSRSSFLMRPRTGAGSPAAPRPASTAPAPPALPGRRPRRSASSSADRSLPSSLKISQAKSISLAIDAALGGDRRMAGAAQRAAEGPLGQHRLMRVDMVDCLSASLPSWRHRRGIRSRSRPAPAPAACLDRSIATPTSCRPSRSSPAAASRVASTSPAASFARRVSTLPRIDTMLEVGPKPPELRGPARRAGADHARLAAARRSNPRRSAGRARRRAGSIAAISSVSGRSLSTSFIEWTEQSVSPGQQREVELLGPQRLAADLGQRPVLDPVAAGLDRR